jgi:hypothetical protein
VLRGRRLFSRSMVGPTDEVGEAESRPVRQLPQSPVYPRGCDSDLGDLGVKREPTTRERLLRLMRGGRYCGVGEILRHLSAFECAAAMGELVDSGYAFDRAGDAFRLRVRGEREPRPLLAEILEGVELTIVVPAKPAKIKESATEVEEVFDPVQDAGAVSSVVSEGRMVLSEPSSSLSFPLSGWGSLTRAILAKRGAGKTYLAGVMIEEIMPWAERPVVVVIDPGGVCWGLLSTSDGAPSPHKILLLGGSRGHFSLGVRDGAAAANIVCAVRPTPVILDLSELAPVEQHELVADFCERLWAREHFPLHLVVDEADEFAPQRFGALARHQRRSLDLLGRLVMRGRARGMGATLISLRPAVLAKNLLSQVDELYLLRLVEANDIRAASTWLENFDHQVTERQRTECLSNLPVLPTGTSYFLRGGDSPMFRRFKVREKHTYDSSRALTSGARDNPVLSSPGAEVLAVAEKILARADRDGDGTGES